MALKMTDLPEHKEMVKNILYIYSNASAEDKAEGMTWYKQAYEDCVDIAVKHSLAIQTVVALVSVVSPGQMWGGNISAPEKIIDLWKRGVPVDDWTGFAIWGHNLRKAERILNGDLTAMNGDKVLAFYANIMGDNKQVTIDRWAIRVVFDDHKIPQDKIAPSGKKVYNALADAYREVAQMVGVDVPEVQAVTWCVYRNRYNGKVRKEKERLAARKYAVA